MTRAVTGYVPQMLAHGSTGDTGGLWLPRSPCGPGCLPSRSSAATAALPTVIARLARTALVLLGLIAALPVLTFGPAATAQRMVRRIAGALLSALGVEHLRCRAVPAGALLVANHISWLDVLAVLATVPARPVAKREVLRWPGIGAAAAALGTIAIDRSRPKRLPVTVAAVASALRSGDSVLVFPEATTWCGRASGRFRPAMFQAAVDVNAPVVPIRLGYAQLADDRRLTTTTVAAFVGRQTLLASAIRVLTARNLVVTVVAQPAVRAPRRAGLARAAQLAIDPGQT